MAEIDNLILEQLRGLRGDINGFRLETQEQFVEVKHRLGHLEEQYASISRRVDRIDERLDRVKRRLDLVDE